MRVKIITDSASDLPKEIIEKYNLEVIPILVYLGENEYRDGETITPKEMFDGMREGKVYKTAQVSAGRFKEIFTEIAEKKESCIYIAFSSGLSGTYQTAVLIKDQLLDTYPDLDLDIVDTKCASGGFGLVVLKALEMAEAGKSKTEILETVNFYIDHMEHIFTVDDLETLYRGGRVSRTAAFIGGLLNIKPVLDVADGKLRPIEKSRGKKVYPRMVELVAERGVDLAQQRIGINHGDDLESLEKVKKMLSEKFGCQEFIINSIGCAIGAHSGPGTLAVFFLNELPPK